MFKCLILQKSVVIQSIKVVAGCNVRNVPYVTPPDLVLIGFLDCCRLYLLANM